MLVSFQILFFIVYLLIWIYLRKSFQRHFIQTYQFNHHSILFFDLFIIFSTSIRFLFRIYSFHSTKNFINLCLNLSSIGLGLLGLLCLLFIFLDFENFLYFFKKKLFHHVPEETTTGRRVFLKKAFTLGGLATSGIITGIGLKNSFNPILKNISILLPNEFIGLRGLKIAQLSDLHLGPTLKREFASQVVDRTNALNADLIVITGDLVDGLVRDISEEVLPLKNLSAPLGVFFITGNHEYYWNKTEWLDFISSELGILPLINANKLLEYKGHPFGLSGVTDLHSSRFDSKNAPDYKLAKKGLPDSLYKILLAHQPKACFSAVKENYHLQLSGHTHGGQGFPWNIIVSFFQPYLKGLYNHEGLILYVQAGTGFWGPPNRFMVDSEIALIEFT